MFLYNNLVLVDFGFATPYCNKECTEHISEGQLDMFRGNIMFSSHSQLQFNKTSRKDDLISLCYFMLYFLNEGRLPGINIPKGSHKLNTFDLMSQ